LDAVHECRLAFDDEEELGVGVFVEPRPTLGLGVCEEDRGGNRAIVVADGLARRLGLRDVVGTQESDRHRRASIEAHPFAA